MSETVTVEGREYKRDPLSGVWYDGPLRLDVVTAREGALLDALAAAEQRIAELEQCAAFVQWVRQEWHHDGDIDGGALQDALTECGLLTPTEVHAPCDPEACQCAEYGEFPVVCYRWADAARQEAAP